MEKFVILAGSFNPITKAHVLSLKSAMTAVGATRGCFLPVCDTYLRKKMTKNKARMPLSSKIRLEMLKAICDTNVGLEVCDYEIQVENSENTHKSLEHIKSTYPEYEPYFVIGADKLKSITHWTNVERLLQDFYFIVLERGDEGASSRIEDSELLSRYKEHFKVIPALSDFSDVSATAVREKFFVGDESYRDTLYPEVADILTKVDLSDYPEVDEYDWIESMLQLAPFDKAKAYKRVYQLNKEYLPSVCAKYGVPQSIVFNNDIPQVHTQIGEAAKVEVKIAEVYQAVNELKAVGLKPAVLCEMNPTRAGGQYDLGGSDTLEEELCRISTLSLALFRYGNPRQRSVAECGIGNEGNAYPLGLYDGIYSTGVYFFRGKGNGYRLLADSDVCSCDVVSIAPINFTQQDKVNDLCYANADGTINDEGTEIMKNKLRIAFDEAISNGCNAMVLNAFGCGFHLPLNEVARILSDVIEEYKPCFKQIIVCAEIKKRYKALSAVL